MIGRIRMAAALLATCAALGATAAGCAPRDVSYAGPVNLRVTNLDADRLHVYVDGDSVGDVSPGATAGFSIRSGNRRLELRESGALTREWQGDYDFSTSSIVAFVYDPSVTENLSVQNTGVVDMEVFVDLQYVGTVRVGESQTWLIRSGQREVHAREVGAVALDWIGDYNFNTSELVQLTFYP